jgi:hypothetical protein
MAGRGPSAEKTSAGSGRPSRLKYLRAHDWECRFIRVLQGSGTRGLHPTDSGSGEEADITITDGHSRGTLGARALHPNNSESGKGVVTRHGHWRGGHLGSGKRTVELVHWVMDRSERARSAAWGWALSASSAMTRKSEG